MKKHGDGKYYYADGNIYEGKWRNNKKHGKGIYSVASMFCDLWVCYNG